MDVLSLVLLYDVYAYSVLNNVNIGSCLMMIMYAQFVIMFNVGCIGYEWYFELCDFFCSRN